MSSNQDKILSFYSENKEDGRDKISRSVSLEFHYTKKILSKYITKSSEIIELGCGTGYYGMHFAESCASYVGVDMSPENIAVFNSKIAASDKKNLSAIVGDATNLSDFKSDSFDVVMCLGPMYHLPREERAKVFTECLRIARNGATVAFAYINRLGVYSGACAIDEQYPNAETSELVFEHDTGDILPGTFLFTSPEEMEEDARSCGFEILENCGLDFLFASKAIDAMSEEQFKHYMKLADRQSESRSCVGLANHALLVCNVL